MSDNPNQKILQLKRIIQALTKDIGHQEMAQFIAQEFCEAVLADSACVYLLSDDDSFVMVSEVGCTPEFKETWARIPKTKFTSQEVFLPGSDIFFGSSGDFSRQFPNSTNLVKKSGRNQVGYGLLKVHGRTIGLVGFAYNESLNSPIDPPFVCLLKDLCAQALERARLSEAEKSASQAKTQFLATMSHEIRTPLSLIQGYTELLKETELSPEQRQWTDTIHRNIKQVVELMDEILDISRIESAKLDIQPTEIDPAALVEDVEKAMRFKASKKQIELSVNCHNFPSRLHVDGKRLRQILLNLIGNAIKFTSAGYIRLDLKVCEQGKILDGTIADSGIGIAPDDHQKIFEPYGQVKNNGQPCQGGTGLGLPITRALARAMGGDLKLVRSQTNEGSTFHFHLNCSEPLDTKKQRAQQLHNLKVLVVDDSEDNQAMIAHILKTHGAQVTTSSNGSDAIDRALNNHFDVILMDIQMPQLDGNEATARLRMKDYTKPILALTANALQSERIKSLDHGFDDYLTKPINMNDLIKTLEKFTPPRHSFISKVKGLD